MLPSCTLKGDSQGGSFQFLVSSAQQPWGAVSEVHGVSSNRDLHSTSGGESRIISMVCNTWGVSKEVLLCLALGFLLDDLWPWHGKISFKLCMYIYTQTYVYPSVFKLGR